MGSRSCQVASVPPGQAGRGRGPVQEASLCSSGPRSWQEVALLLEERQSPQSSDSRYRPTPHQGRLRRAGLLGGVPCCLWVPSEEKPEPGPRGRRQSHAGGRGGTESPALWAPRPEAGQRPAPSHMKEESPQRQARCTATAPEPGSLRSPCSCHRDRKGRSGCRAVRTVQGTGSSGEHD